MSLQPLSTRSQAAGVVSPSQLKVTVHSCAAKKQRGEKITCLTAYDASFARLLDESGIDLLLVGDSFAMTAQGYASTLPITVEEMLWATRAVSRVTRRALVIGDLPYGSYQLSPRQAVKTGIRFIKEGGAEAVKLEGGRRRAAAVRALVEAEIPVMGHIGLTPQSLHAMGGYKVQGRSPEQAKQLLDDAAVLVEAGIFALVLEGIPAELAAEITRSVPVPTIGIGAGPQCDGQVLVLHDLLGLTPEPRPKFVRAYADLGAQVRHAAELFRHDVEGGSFPSQDESYHLGRTQASAAKQ